MPINPTMRRRIPAVATSLILVGCAAAPPQRWDEWTDPALGQNSGVLRGKVLIACETFDLLMRAPCQDDLSRALASRGASPVVASATPLSTGSEAQWAAAAATVGAPAVFVLSLMPQATSATSASSGVSVGIGGFSWGRSGGAGIGLSAPVGGGWGGVGFSATGRVIDVSSGRMLWSTTFVGSSGSDVGGQIRELQRNVLDAAQAAGLL